MLPNKRLLQTPHTLEEGRAVLRQRGRLFDAAQQKRGR